MSSARAQDITPEAAPAQAVTEQAAVSQEVVGLFRSLDGNVLQLRLPDGTSQTYTVDPAQTSSLALQRGELVTVVTDANNQVTQIQPAAVEEVLTGEVQSITGDQVVLELPNGEVQTTTVPVDTITRMGLAAGKPLVVTKYLGTWATRVCLGKEAPVPVAQPPAPPENIGGGELPPVRALW